MSEPQNHIEQMQRRLEQVAAREQLLIHALNEALAAADRKLLDEVRAVASDHEARRSIILTELHSLAERIGAFPTAPEPLQSISYHTVPQPTAAAPAETATYIETPSRGGDWRKAAEKIGQELDFRLNGGGSKHVA